VKRRLKIRTTSQSNETPDPSGQSQLLLIAIIAWAVLGSAAINWPSLESKAFQANRARLQRMNPEQRQTVWRRFQEFLALPPTEQERIRQLSADLLNLPADRQERYRGITERYMRWKDTLPLYQQHMLEDAAQHGANELYAKFREVQDRNKTEGRLRQYWFVPEAAPAVRKAIPRILAKLAPEEIDELDQTPPLERTVKLLAAGQRVGVELPISGGAAPGLPRQALRGPLPPPDPDKFREFLQKLPREDLEELGDLGLMKRARERRLFEMYYRANPDELRLRLRKLNSAPGSGANSMRTRSITPSSGNSPTTA
jgi:hypothetical protein